MDCKGLLAGFFFSVVLYLHCPAKILSKLENYARQFNGICFFFLLYSNAYNVVQELELVFH